MKNKPPKTENLATRPPIVVVMGHIDHGKSTLLDYIRKTAIATGKLEASPSTSELTKQRPSTTAKKKNNFLDTPGHEAFLK